MGNKNSTKQEMDYDTRRKFSNICVKTDEFCTKLYRLYLELDLITMLIEMSSRDDKNKFLEFWYHDNNKFINKLTSFDRNIFDSINNDIQSLQTEMKQSTFFDILSNKLSNINMSEFKIFISLISQNIQTNNLDSLITPEFLEKVKQIRIHIKTLCDTQQDISNTLKVNWYQLV